jgi:hypothetical protein
MFRHLREAKKKEHQIGNYLISDLRATGADPPSTFPGRELVADQCNLPTVCLEDENRTSFWYDCRFQGKSIRKSAVGIAEFYTSSCQ